MLKSMSRACANGCSMSSSSAVIARGLETVSAGRTKPGVSDWWPV